MYKTLAYNYVSDLHILMSTINLDIMFYSTLVAHRRERVDCPGQKMMGHKRVQLGRRPFLNILRCYLNI